MTLSEAPTPVYPSRRLVGPEVEIDAGSGAYHEPELPAGWAVKTDQSLGNGREFVLEPPQPLGEVLPSVDMFSAAVTKAKMHVVSRGGFHVHVQVADYTHANAYNLCRLYHHFRLVIDLTVGASRRSTANDGVGNNFCAPFRVTDVASLESFVEAFHLERSARDRAEAKSSRLRLAINCAMMRVNDPLQRTVEFRQPSSSKHSANIYGWMCMATALVDAAKNDTLVTTFLSKPPTVRNYLRMMRHVELHVGCAHLVQWITWRIRYLGSTPTSRQRAKLAGCLAHRPHGLLHVARALNVNMAVAKRLVAAELASGGITETTPGRYRSCYAARAEHDFKLILELWRALETPAQLAQAP